MPTTKKDAVQIAVNRKRKKALFRQLQGDGYMQAEGNEIDAEVCAELVCECGHLGTKYYAFRKRMNMGCYRAVSVCPKCGKAEEF